MSSLPVGTTVKLEGLSSAEYNGKKGRVAVTAQDVIARGRVAVIVDGATLSFKRANVRRYFPSDDSDESDEEDEAAPPPPKRAAGGTFVLTILTGWSSIETSTIVGTYGTWAEVISKAKEILDKGYGGDDFWCTEENGGYREENEDDFEDNTSAKEPKGKGTVELASAKHCEGDKGNMILQAQRM